jgi:hypothetical protein
MNSRILMQDNVCSKEVGYVGGTGKVSTLLAQSIQVNAAFFTTASHWICRIEQVGSSGNTSALYSGSSRLDFQPEHRLVCRSCFSSIQANVRRIPQISLQFLPSTFFPSCVPSLKLYTLCSLRYLQRRKIRHE